MQNQPAVCQYFEENDNSTKRFGAKTTYAYDRTCKTKSPRMFADPSRAYASAEQSAVRGVYVDPNMLVLTLT